MFSFTIWNIPKCEALYINATHLDLLWIKYKQFFQSKVVAFKWHHYVSTLYVKVGVINPFYRPHMHEVSFALTKYYSCMDTCKSKLVTIENGRITFSAYEMVYFTIWGDVSVTYISIKKCCGIKDGDIGMRTIN